MFTCSSRPLLLSKLLFSNFFLNPKHANKPGRREYARNSLEILEIV
jgi:hypothetical protein